MKWIHITGGVTRPKCRHLATDGRGSMRAKCFTRKLLSGTQGNRASKTATVKAKTGFKYAVDNETTGNRCGKRT